MATKICQYGIKEWRQEFPLWLVWPRFSSNLTSVLLSPCLHLSVVCGFWPICCLSVVCAWSVPAAFLLCLYYISTCPQQPVFLCIPCPAQKTQYEKGTSDSGQSSLAVLQGWMLLSWHNSPRRTLKPTQMLSTASTCCFQHLFSLWMLSNCWLLLAKDCHNTHICYSILGAWENPEFKIKAMYYIVRTSCRRNLRNS